MRLNVFRSQLRSTRITIFTLLILLAAVGIVRSLTSTSAATPDVATKPDPTNRSARFDLMNSNPFTISGLGKLEKKNTQDQQPQRADESQSVQQRGSKPEGDEHHDISPPLYAIPPAARRTDHKIHDHEKLPRPTNPN